MTDYAFSNQRGVLAVVDKSKEEEPKTIRFIYPDYSPRFEIPDGDYVVEVYKSGTAKAKQCHYIDDTHLVVGNSTFHICEYAERLANIGAKVYPLPEKRVVWSDIDLDPADWQEMIDELDGNFTDEQINAQIEYENASYLDDERANLNIEVGEILVIGDLGRWNGRVNGYKLISSGNISECLTTECDRAEWYVDRDGDLRATMIHHDGTNYLRYRKFRNGISDEDREQLLDDIYNGCASEDEIRKVTCRLGDDIAKVYGWVIPSEE